MAKLILDPLWITKGKYFDAEYFKYILLAASQKYQKEIDQGGIDHFDEVLFHILNLNNLAIDGDLFDFKFKQVVDDSRVNLIREQLKKIYDIPSETIEIFRNANYIFMNLLLDYLDIQLEILDSIKLYYVNRYLHDEKEIYLVTNYENESEYSIWKITESKRSNFGYKFEFIIDIVLDELKPNALSEKITNANDPRLKNMSGDTNVIFAILKKEHNKVLSAKIVKNLITLNKGIAKKLPFELNLMDEVNALIWTEKVMPFTLGAWSTGDSARIKSLF